MIATGRLVIMVNKIAELDLQVVLSEEVSSPMSKSNNAVELGADITDHTVVEPVKISISGVISSWQDGQYVSSRMSDVYNQIITYRNQRTPLTIDTGVSIHDNMFITNVDRSRTNLTSQGFSFSIDFEEFFFAQLEEVQLIQSNKRPASIGTSSGSQPRNSKNTKGEEPQKGGKGSSSGKTGGTKEPSDQDKTSVLYDIINT